MKSEQEGEKERKKENKSYCRERRKMWDKIRLEQKIGSTFEVIFYPIELIKFETFPIR
jgi:hypothetical protein